MKILNSLYQKYKDRKTRKQIAREISEELKNIQQEKYKKTVNIVDALTGKETPKTAKKIDATIKEIKKSEPLIKPETKELLTKHDPVAHHVPVSPPAFAKRTQPVAVTLQNTPKIELRVGNPVLKMRVDNPNDKSMEKHMTNVIKTTIDYTLQDAFEKEFPGKHSVWRGKETKMFISWKEKNKK